MKVRFSRQLIDDLQDSVRRSLTLYGVVNVPVVAEQVRQRNEIENVALEDITAELMAQAQRFSAAMVFDTQGMN